MSKKFIVKLVRAYTPESGRSALFKVNLGTFYLKDFDLDEYATQYKETSKMEEAKPILESEFETFKENHRMECYLTTPCGSGEVVTTISIKETLTIISI
jgi:hypothetical protein